MSQNDAMSVETVLEDVVLESGSALETVNSYIGETDSYVDVEVDVVEEIDFQEPDVDEEGQEEEEEADSISSEARVVKPVPQARPPPDLRFEESYLRAISAAEGKWWKIAYITVRDQVFMPLVQGTIWSFLLLSASSLRSKSSGSGRYYGSSIVRWWRSINPPNGKH